MAGITTAADIIRSAIRVLTAQSSAEDISAEEMNDGLNALNLMLDAWSLESLFVYHHQLVGPFSTTAGVSAYAVGTASTWATARPNRIESAQYTVGQSKYEVKGRTTAEWDALPAGVTGQPEYLYYEMSYPAGTVNVWPTPDAAYSLSLRVPKQLQQFASATEEVLLPPGTKEALKFNLAVRLAPEYGVEPTATVIAMATASAGRLKRNNIEQIRASLEIALFSGRAARQYR